MKNTITILIILATVLSSCTVGKLSITKRHYRSGYSIDYATAGKVQKIEATSQKVRVETVADQLAMALPDSANQQVLMSTTYADMVSNIPIDNSSKNIAVSSNEQLSGNKTIYHQTKVNDNYKNNITPNDTITTQSQTVTTTSGSKPVEINSLLGFIFSFLGIAVAALFIVFLGTVFDNFVMLSPLFTLAGIILSLVGLRRFRRNPDKYSGKLFAYLGMVFSSLAILFWLAFIALLIIFLTMI